MENTQGRRVESGAGSAGSDSIVFLFASYVFSYFRKTRIRIFFLVLSYFEPLAI